VKPILEITDEVRDLANRVDMDVLAAIVMGAQAEA
jgi:hypothetical protein